MIRDDTVSSRTNLTESISAIGVGDGEEPRVFSHVWIYFYRNQRDFGFGDRCTSVRAVDVARDLAQRGRCFLRINTRLCWGILSGRAIDALGVDEDRKSVA